jgi:hypothetical protein
MLPGNFRHAVVRDLAWAGFGPLLIKTDAIGGAGLRCSPFWIQHLAELDDAPAPLHEFLDTRAASRLGLYYETLWHYLLENDPEIDLIAHNYPVRDGDRTVGEFDCLYWSGLEGRHIHLELAFKFYLGVPDSGIWLGPGQRDQLDMKLDRLVCHQSRLAEHPAAREALLALGIDRPESRIDIKGYLFEPGSGMTPPSGHNAACPLQAWHPVSEFQSLDPPPAHWLGWQVIPRRRWLSPYHASDAVQRSADEIDSLLAEKLSASGSPVLLAACDASGIEQRRCFVTPDEWPLS